MNFKKGATVMNMSRNTSLVIIMMLMFFCPIIKSGDVMAQADNSVWAGSSLKFDNLTTDDGLSSTAVISILQDYQGFIWTGTHAGLNRYDGYNFKTYKREFENEHSLSHDFVWILFEDSHNNLWVGTNGGGMNLYDRVTDGFIHYSHNPDDSTSLPSGNVKSFYEDNDGVLWVGTDGGLSKLNRETGEFFTYRHDPGNSNSLSNNSIRFILEDQETGLLWLGTRLGGVTVFNRETEQFTHYEFDPNDPNSISNNAVTHISQDRTGNLWLSTRNGFNRFDRETKTFIRYSHNQDNPESISDNYVFSSYEDSKNRFWVLTRNGLNLFDAKTNIFKRYYHEPKISNSIGGNQIRTVYEDNTDNLWFGTMDGGLSRFVNDHEKFVTYSYNPDSPNGLNISHVRKLFVDNAGDVWFSTQNGLNCFDGQTFTNYQHDSDDPNSISHNFIFEIVGTPQGGLWIGTDKGMDYFDGETFTRYEHNPQNPKSIRGPGINAICPDNSGGLWLNSHGLGLDYFDGKTFSHYQLYETDSATNSETLYISQIIKDIDDETLWITTSCNGLFRRDAVTKKFTRFFPAPEQPNNITLNEIKAIYQDKSGMIWIGGSSGLRLFNPDTELFMQHYTKDDGLADNVVLYIAGENQEQLWISTQNGLSRFNPQSETFRNYYEADGLPCNQFSSIAETPDGQMFLGSIKGLTAFYSSRLKDNPIPPPVILTGFELFNQPVVIGAEDSPLKQAINVADELFLSYDQSVFTFEFAALNYTVPEKNQYAYKMEGFDNDWRPTTSDRRFATYTNLDPATYVFRVKASNNDGVWNEKGLSLPITITPPWWKTNWFRILTFLTIISLLFSFYRWRIQSVEKQKRLLEIQVNDRTRDLNIAKEKAEVANRAKSTFLANMSHELRTPLNSILGFAQITNRDRTLPEKHKKNIEIINRSGQYLLTLINQVLDLAKIEAGKIELVETNFDLSYFIEELNSLFRVRVQEKGLQFDLQISQNKHRYIKTDDIKLRQIIINLIGNAIKFTKKGKISLIVKSEKTPNTKNEKIKLYIEVMDTGVGISKEELKMLFQAFVQTESGQKSREGTGLGLAISFRFVKLLGGQLKVISKPGIGSRFYFEIPVQEGEESKVHEIRKHKIVVGVVKGQQKKKVLIVDDIIDNRNLLDMLLKSLNTPEGEAEPFEIRIAVNGQEAVEINKEWEPQLIFMDMRMPVMDGYQASKKIKSSAKGKFPIIIALTASVYEDEYRKVISSGCSDIIRKPFHDYEIFDILEKYLGIEFIYETEALKKVKTEDNTLSEKIGLLPEEIIHNLKKAVTELNVDQARTISLQISKTDKKLSALIVELIEEFRFDVLQKLIKEADNET